MQQTVLLGRLLTAIFCRSNDALFLPYLTGKQNVHLLNSEKIALAI